VEKQLDRLRLEVTRMNRFFERETLAGQQAKLGIIGAAEAAGGTLLPIATDSALDAGMTQARSVASDVEWDSRRVVQGDSRRAESSRMGQGRLPKLQFPVFSGDDPQLWRSCCEIYFDMYEVEYSLWIRVASMHMEGVAVHWLQSMERRIQSASWGGIL
jgi:hypothetical protein